MGYQQVIPPVPDRSAELRALDKLEASWRNQSYFNCIMNEDLRELKIKYYIQSYIVSKEWVLNTVIGAFIMAPLTYGMRRLYIQGYAGVPKNVRITQFQRNRTTYDHRFYEYVVDSWGVMLLGSLAIGTALTNFERRQDQYYDKFVKVDRMM